MSALHQDEDDPRHSDVTFDEENELLVAAANLFDVEKLSDARNALRMIRDPRIFSERHHHINNVARECEESILELIGEPGTVESGWSKQGESHGKFDTTIYYKVDDESKLTCRLETPIESSLLVPLLSVMNESDLYLDWCPSWRVLNGNIGIRSSRRLERIGRVNQMLHVVADLPWPFSPREVFMQTVALDDIDTNGYFAVRLHSNNLTSQAPPLQSNMERINFEGILLFRPYPLDSVVVASGQVTAENEPKILVSFKMWCDAKLSSFPASFINFITRTVIGEVWSKLLDVAQEVRLGKRPNHEKAIKGQPEIYQFIRERIDTMISKIVQEKPSMEDFRLISHLLS